MANDQPLIHLVELDIGILYRSVASDTGYCYTRSSVVGLAPCVCLFLVICEPRKNSWTDRDAVWGLTCVGQRNHVSDGVKVGRIHSPPWGVTRRRCGLSSKLFDHLLYFYINNGLNCCFLPPAFDSMTVSPSRFYGTVFGPLPSSLCLRYVM